jgi:hypothetical protein
MLHLSTIQLGRHQTLTNITQVIKILVIKRIRIFATDVSVASEYIYIYILLRVSQATRQGYLRGPRIWTNISI